MKNNIGEARRSYAARTGKFTQEDAAAYFGVIRRNAEILALDWHKKSALLHEGTERNYPICSTSRAVKRRTEHSPELGL